MKIKVLKEVEVNLTTLHVDAGVRYWEDATINGVEDVEGLLIPCRKGDAWCPIIQLETGKIHGWPEGTIADIHYKVCDSGNYYIYSDEHEIVLERVNNYVPEMLDPKEGIGGDYIIMEVDCKGYIKDWKINLDGFIEV